MEARRLDSQGHPTVDEEFEGSSDSLNLSKKNKK